MCARPDPEIIAITPIGEIVTAFLSRRGMVRDLVGRKTGRLTHLLREGVKVRRQVRPRHTKLPAPIKSKNAVSGSMVSWYSERWPRAKASASRSSARHSNSVCPGLAYIRSKLMRSKYLPATSRACRASAAVCSRPRKRNCSSESDCTPRETRLTPADAIAFETVGFDTGGVRLKGDLTCAFDRPKGSYFVEELAHRMRHHERGCSAAKEYARKGTPSCFGRVMIKLAERRLQILLFAYRSPRIGVEVAIGALRLAKWPMNIDRERILRPPRRRATFRSLPRQWRRGKRRRLGRGVRLHACCLGPFHRTSCRTHRVRTWDRSRSPACREAAKRGDPARSLQRTGPRLPDLQGRACKRTSPGAAPGANAPIACRLVLNL